MAFSLSGSIITQTGTDANLSGLSAIAGVTVVNGSTYDIGSLSLRITGNLTLNGEQLLIDLASYSQQLLLTGNAVKSLTLVDSRLVFRKSAQIAFSATTMFGPNTTFTATRSEIVLDHNGFLNRGSFFSAFEAGSNITVNFTDFIFTSLGIGSAIQVSHIYWSTTSVISGFTMRNNGNSGALVLEFTPNTFKGLSFGGQLAGASGAHASSGNVFLPDFVYTSSQDVPAAFSRDIRWHFQSPTRLDGGVFDYALPRFGTISYIWEYSADLGGRTGAKFFIDTTNTDTATRAAYPAKTITTDTGNITSADLGGHLVKADSTVDSGVKQNLLPYNWRFCHYELNISSGQITSLDADTLFPGSPTVDASITETTKAVVDAYTELETPQKFYDRAKAWLVDNYAGQTTPLLTRAGDAINAGAYNITIDKTATAVFAFDGTTLTIKADKYTGNLKTAGLVSLANGATTNGVIIDANQNSALSFTGIDSWIVYAASTDRNTEQNPLGSGTAQAKYAFNYVQGTTYYLSLKIAGEIIRKDIIPAKSGETKVSLEMAGQLAAITAQINAGVRTDETALHAALDSYTQKANWKADTTALATEKTTSAARDHARAANLQTQTA